MTDIASPQDNKDAELEAMRGRLEAAQKKCDDLQARLEKLEKEFDIRLETKNREFKAKFIEFMKQEIESL